MFDILINALSLAALMWIGGVLSVAVGMLVVRALDILENDYD